MGTFGNRRLVPERQDRQLTGTARRGTCGTVRRTAAPQAHARCAVLTPRNGIVGSAPFPLFARMSVRVRTARIELPVTLEAIYSADACHVILALHRRLRRIHHRPGNWGAFAQRSAPMDRRRRPVSGRARDRPRRDRYPTQRPVFLIASGCRATSATRRHTASTPASERASVRQNPNRLAGSIVSVSASNDLRACGSDTLVFPRS